MSSIVWNFFEKPDHITDSLPCPKCNMMLAYKGTTSGMKKHMKSKHPVEYQRCVELGQQQSLQITTQNLLSYRYIERVRDPHELLASSFCTGRIPFSFADNPEFMEFCTSLNSCYKIPHSKEIRGIVEAAAVHQMMLVRRHMDTVKEFVLICDGFSSTSSPFFSIHVSFVDQTSLERNTVLCKAMPLENQNIFEEIQMIQENFKLPTEKCIGIISDESMDCKNFFKDFKHLPCAGTVINQIYESFADYFQSVRELYLEVEDIFKVLYENPEDLELAKTQRLLQKTDVVLAPLGTFPPSKWGSLFTLFHSYASDEIYFPSIPCLQNKIVSPEKSTEIRRILNLFQPLQNILEELTKESSFTSDVVPNLLCVKEELDLNDEMAMKLADLIQEKITCYLYNDYVLLAMLSDPRYAYIPNIIDPRSWREAEQLFAQEESTADESNGFLRKLNESNNPQPSGLAGLLKRKLNSEDVMRDLASELLHYQAMMTTHRPSHTSDPLHFWKEQTHNFPKMARIAVKFLTAMATTSPAEKLYRKCYIDVIHLQGAIPLKEMHLYLMGHALAPEISHEQDNLDQTQNQFVDPFPGNYDNVMHYPSPLVDALSVATQQYDSPAAGAYNGLSDVKDEYGTIQN